MASTLPRQPFAPLDGARLQGLTSLKNRQNAPSPASLGKRKADSIDADDDAENLDPTLFTKRTKGSDSFFSNEPFKPSNFVLTKASSNAISHKFTTPSSSNISNPVARARTIIQPRSPAARLNSSLTSSLTPLSAPAGRSPTRGSKRIGILSNRRRTASPYTRVAPPSFGGSSAAAPFSLDAALQGTVSSYASRHAAVAAPAAPIFDDLYGSSSLDGSWNFEIHEDTPEQEMTNLLQHSTCVLEISSDEENEQKASRERAEGRDKENVPPADDVSQVRTAARPMAARTEDEMLFEKTRGPLAEMNTADYYADGYDLDSFVIVPGEYLEDDDAERIHHGDEELCAAATQVDGGKFDLEPEAGPEPSADVSIDSLMGHRDGPAPQAALLQPMEGTGESFDLWESCSSKDDAEPERPGSPAPQVLAALEETSVTGVETVTVAPEALPELVSC